MNERRTWEVAIAALVLVAGLAVGWVYRKRRRPRTLSPTPAARQVAATPEIRTPVSGMAALACGLSEADLESRQPEVAFDPRVLLEQCARLYAERAHAKGLRLRTAVAPNVPKRVRGDASRISRVFLNLLDNAVKFTGEGAVRGEIVWTRDASRARTLRVNVYDTGVGIDAETL